MKEGKYKTNVKPPYLECKSCGYRAPNYNFSHGMWWWKKIHCPICESVVIETATRPKVAPAPQRPKHNNLDDKRHLMFIYKRLTNFHLEDPKVNYMVIFKNIIDRK